MRREEKEERKRNPLHVGRFEIRAASSLTEIYVFDWENLQVTDCCLLSHQGGFVRPTGSDHPDIFRQPRQLQDFVCSTSIRIESANLFLGFGVGFPIIEDYIHVDKELSVYSVFFDSWLHFLGLSVSIPMLASTYLLCTVFVLLLLLESAKGLRIHRGNVEVLELFGNLVHTFSPNKVKVDPLHGVGVIFFGTQGLNKFTGPAICCNM